MDVWMPLATQDQLAAQRSVTQKIQRRNAVELPAAFRHSAFDIRECGTVGDGQTCLRTADEAIWDFAGKSRP
jgi:hypothetical protein